MDDFRDVAALRKLFDLARQQVPVGRLASHVMNDPGTGGYIAAYTKLLREGLHALGDEYDGGRLVDSFDIQENLSL